MPMTTEEKILRDCRDYLSTKKRRLSGRPFQIMSQCEGLLNGTAERCERAREARDRALSARRIRHSKSSE